MELSTISSIGSFLLLMLLALSLILLTQSRKKNEALATELAKQTHRHREQLEMERENQLELTERLLTLSSQSSQKTTEGLLQLVQHGQALVAAADVISYQQIAVMQSPSVYDGGEYDPSENGEVERIRLRSERLAGDDPEKESLNGYEEQIAVDYGFGGGFNYTV